MAVKNLLTSLRSFGLSSITINIAIVSLISFLTLLGCSCIFIVVQEVVTGQRIQPSIISILTLLAAAGAGLLTISHVATNMNNSAQASQEASQTDRDSQTAAIIANAAVVSQSVLKALSSVKQEVIDGNAEKTPPTSV